MNSNPLLSVQSADNPEPRSPASMILDTSGSMGTGGRIGTLNQTLSQFKDDISGDTLVSLRAEISLVTFNDRVDFVDFCPVDEFEPPVLRASGGTLISPAINTALDLLDRRKQAYREAGISYYRALAVLLTDGKAHDPAEELAKVRQRLTFEEEGRHVAFFAIGIEEADVDELSQITPPNRPPLHIGSVENIAGLFKWLRNSMRRISGSTPGDRMELDPIEEYIDKYAF